MNKKRILICNDAHFTHSGYGKYGKEVLTRLAATGKYELAELACYGHIDSKNRSPQGWRYYANAVDSNHPDFKEYRASSLSELGAWRWERTVLDFHPDIVFDIRDPHVNEFISYSPLREFYHLCLMPTVDSAPQRPQWVDSFRLADSIRVYSEWAIPVLERCGLTVSGLSSPGISLDTFKPTRDKRKHREIIGIAPDALIVGTIMRNQTRKLYPDLCEVLRMVLEKAPQEISSKLFFYFHTGYPDAGWNIPSLLQEFGIANKVLLTYICSHCSAVMPSLYRDTVTPCLACGQKAKLTNPSIGISDKQLAHIINTFDIYAQYSVCEGFGMSQVEAAACGVPIMSIDYSAMADVVRNVGGIPLKPLTMFRDVVMDAYRAIPDNKLAADTIISFFLAQQSYRDELAKVARSGVETYYTWDKCAKSWEDHFDSIVLTGNQGKYDIPFRNFNMPTIPKNINNYEFANWAMSILYGNTMQNSHKALTMAEELETKARLIGKNTLKINRQLILEEIERSLEFKKETELARTNPSGMVPNDFILAANQEE